MAPRVSDVVPTKPDKLAYWIAAAVAGALAGGLVYQLLRYYDPL